MRNPFSSRATSGTSGTSATPHTPATQSRPTSPPLGLRRGPRPRRSPAMMILGVVLAASGAIGSVALYTNIGQTQEVVAVANAVYRGEQIERSDLIIVYMRVDPTLAIVPGSDIDQVVGTYAHFELVPGSTLSTAAFSNRLPPPDGHTEVGLVLGEGRFPNNDLRPGDTVRLVDCSINNPAPTGYAAILWTVNSVDANGTLRASVMVNGQDADTIVSLAANGNLALALVARGGR